MGAACVRRMRGRCYKQEKFFLLLLLFLVFFLLGQLGRQRRRGEACHVDRGRRRCTECVCTFRVKTRSHLRKIKLIPSRPLWHDTVFAYSILGNQLCDIQRAGLPETAGGRKGDIGGPRGRGEKGGGEEKQGHANQRMREHRGAREGGEERHSGLSRCVAYFARARP